MVLKIKLANNFYMLLNYNVPDYKSNCGVERGAVDSIKFLKKQFSVLFPLFYRKHIQLRRLSR